MRDWRDQAWQDDDGQRSDGQHADERGGDPKGGNWQHADGQTHHNQDLEGELERMRSQSRRTVVIIVSVMALLVLVSLVGSWINAS
ncbi:MAG: hypothetical protein PUK40_06105 [Actinomycetaceae bacterium]|nr:hypothetical protein [Actinomycetaceae bacterium]MDY6143479.1 hypothetical protein [Arcanobacterium sp.]